MTQAISSVNHKKYATQFSSKGFVSRVGNGLNVGLTV